MSVIAAIDENNRSASRLPPSRPPPERYHRQVQDAGQPVNATIDETHASGLFERIPSPLTLGSDLGKRRSAQRRALDT